MKIFDEDTLADDINDNAVDLLIRNARALTLDAPGPRRGNNAFDLNVLEPADICVRAGRIISVANSGDAPSPASVTTTIDADGRVVLPGFVDCHTHTCWAGQRLDEWERKQRGATYLEILQGGGGIMSTVRAVRQASEEELTELLNERLWTMLRHGTTIAEIKSGYGLRTEAELKMLRAIRRAGEDWPGEVLPTACIGHALDPEVNTADFVERTITETLVAVSAEFPGITIDAYCEQGAWSLADCLKLFRHARELAHPIRVHADQFNSLGMIPAAIDAGFVSVDHLEASTEPQLGQLAQSELFGVMLPCSGFHLDDRYADGRRYVDAGGKLAIATNYNPGSAPCPSMPMAIALAVRKLGLTTAEAIVCSTLNAATLLGLADAGAIRPGHRADLVMLRQRDERQLGFEFGGNPVEIVICAGEIVASSSSG